jgi:hypothetical protein
MTFIADNRLVRADVRSSPCPAQEEKSSTEGSASAARDRYSRKLSAALSTERGRSSIPGRSRRDVQCGFCRILRRCDIRRLS